MQENSAFNWQETSNRLLQNREINFEDLYNYFFLPLQFLPTNNCKFITFFCIWFCISRVNGPKYFQVKDQTPFLDLFDLVNNGALLFSSKLPMDSKKVLINKFANCDNILQVKIARKSPVKMASGETGNV